MKVHVKERTDRILGSTSVARHAGEMINEITLAMIAGIGLRTRASAMAGVVKPCRVRFEPFDGLTHGTAVVYA